MAPVTITRGISAQDYVSDPCPSVWVKPTWNSAWTWVPFCYPIHTEHTMFNTIGQASFEFRFGNVSQPGMSSYGAWDYVTYPNCYIKVDLRNQYGRHRHWLGVIDHESIQCHGNPTIASGVQTFTAHSPQVLLNRIPVMGSFSQCGGDIAYTDMPLTFNESSRRRTVDDTKVGNMTPIPHAGYGAYYFYHATVGDPAAEKWTNLDAANYLLTYYPNDVTGNFGYGGPYWYLSGRYDLLSELITTNDFNGQSVYEALQKLIDPHRGLFATVWTMGGAGDPIFIEVGSMLWGQNSNTVWVDLSDRRLTGTQIEFAHGEVYDQVLVEGGPVSTCFSMTTDPTLQTTMGPLVKGWDSTVEAEYLAITATTHGSPEAADRARNSEYFQSVYQKFIADPTWDGTIGGNIVRPATDVYGYIDWTSATPVFSGKFRASREIPFEATDGETGSEEGLRAPFALVQTSESIGGSPVLMWQYVEKLVVRVVGGGDTPTSGAGSFDVLEKGLGITIKPSVNHIGAILQMLDLASTRHVPLWDWGKIVVTLMVEWPSRLKVLAQVNSGASLAEVVRTKFIQDHDAKASYIMPGTVYDVDPADPTAYLTETSVTPVAFRDDSSRLIDKAFRAATWLQQQMSSISMPIEGIDIGWYPGYLILGVVDGSGFTPCGTVTDVVRHDFRAGTTHVQTATKDWADMDNAVYVGTPRGSGGGRTRGEMINDRMDERFASISAAQDAQFARIENASAGAIRAESYASGNAIAHEGAASSAAIAAEGQAYNNLFRY